MGHWTTKYKNRLPDKNFLLVAPGGRKDASGRTTPKTLRHLPVKDHLGRYSLGHARAAVGRSMQVHAPLEVRKAAQAKAKRIVRLVEEELARKGRRR